MSDPLTPFLAARGFPALGPRGARLAPPEA
jgi:hypothetical protein